MKRKKLPDGLLEFEGTLWLGEIDELLELVHRLRDLPNADFNKDIELLSVAVEQYEYAEATARRACNIVRNKAMKIWKRAKKDYSIKELQEATGYDDE